jgi:hypothetical protein
MSTMSMRLPKASASLSRTERSINIEKLGKSVDEFTNDVKKQVKKESKNK